MKKTSILLTFIAVLSVNPNGASATCHEFKSKSDSVRVSSDSLSRMTEKEFDAYCDSLYRADRSWIKEVTYSDSIKKSSPILRQKKDFAYSNSYVPSSASVNTMNAVGQIDIESGTSPTGARTYTVPIKLYKHDEWFCPDISLVYNSQGGKGTYGKGWSIGGLQSITRSSKTIYYDGKTEGMKMNTDDTFYLNGIRLIRTSTTAYEYETEQGNIKAVATVDGTLTKYFNVYYPNGYTAVFGSTDETSNRLEYPVSTVTDTRGRSVSFYYTFDGGIFYPSSIYYGLSSNISFSYSILGNDYQYRGGIAINNRRLLRSITCSRGGTYTLSYDTNGSTPLLTQIDYSANGSSLNPLKFYYGDGSAVQGYYTDSGHLMNGYSFSNRNMMNAIRGRYDYMAGDDGILFYPNENPYYHKQRSASLFEHSQNYLKNEYNSDPDTHVLMYDNISGNGNINLTTSLTVGDDFIQMLTANLDGSRQECIIKVNNGVENNLDKVTFSVYQKASYGLVQKYTPRTFSYSTVHTDNDGHKSITPKYYFTGDFNGDGKDEILSVSAADPFETGTGTSTFRVYDLNNNTTLYSGSPFNYIKYLEGTYKSAADAEILSDKILPFDYDGDGKMDLCHINTNGMDIYTFSQNGTTWTAQQVATYTGLDKDDLANCYWSVGDFNGDGLMDIVYSSRRDHLGDAYWKFLYSKGDGTFTFSFFVSGPNTCESTSDFLIQDVNSDGISDLIELTDNNFTVYTMNKGELTQEATQTLTNIGEFLAPVNVNSSSLRTQFISLQGTDVTLYSYKTNQQTDQALTGLVNSNGAIEKNYYYTISNDNAGIYSQGYDADFPYVNVYEPITVLAGNEIFVGGASKDSNRYSYENAVVHRQGLGFQGFQYVRAMNKRGLTTTYEYAPLNFCLPMMVWGPVSKITSSYTTTIGTNKIRKSLLTSKEEQDLLRNITATTSYTYDSYGQLLTESTEYPGNITVEKAYSYTNFTNIGSKYYLGRPASQTVTTTRNNSQHTEQILFTSYNSYDQPLCTVHKINNGIIKTNAYVYNSNGSVTSLSITPYSSQLANTTTYQYDMLNRLIRVTDPLGVWKEYTYNTNGTVATMSSYTGTTNYTYDNFGRQISVTRPDSTTVNTSFTWNSSNGGLYAITKSGTSIPTETTIYDALNREIRLQQTRFDGSLVKIDKVYDTYGNLSRESYPYKTGAPTYKQYSYDTYNRLTSMYEGGKTTSYSYNGLSTTVNDGTMSKTTTTDALGGMVSVTDPAGTVNYTLNGAGDPTSISAPTSSGSDIETTITYDSFGRRTSISDPSSGTTSYGYHATEGRLQSETNAKNQMIGYFYDIYGRLTRKTTSEFYTDYTYNNNLNVITAANSSNGTSTTYSYDNRGRLMSTRENAVDNKWLQRDYTYADGRVNTIKYTSQDGELVTEVYTYTNGHLTNVATSNHVPIFHLNSEDNSGRASNVTVLGLQRNYGYTVSGLPTSRSVSSNSTTFQNLTYNFNPYTGNLVSLTNGVNGLTEQYTYDNLHRLTSYGGTTVTYDDNGNITSKGDIGSFAYDTPDKPYAVSEVTLNNNVSVGTQNVSYYSFNRPSMVTDNGYTAAFTYNANFDRVKMELLHNSTASLTRYYLGGCYELDAKPAGNMEKLYLMGGYYDSPLVLVKQNGNSSYYMVLRDHLGSITQVIGSSSHEQSYDAWGRLRNPSTYEVYAPGSEPDLFLGRGYCGHEHIPGIGLINMNARLYDPLIGRFLSPDPYVQAPDFSQSFNRYSYCMNNPLIVIDRDGQLWFVPILVGAAIGAAFSAATYTAMVVFTPMTWNSSQFWRAVGMGALGGALGGAAGLAGSALGVTQAGNLLGYNILSQTTNSLITNAVFGQRTELSDIIGIAAGATISSVLPKFGAINAKPIINTLAETGFNSLRGAATGIVKGTVDAIIHKDVRYIYQDAIGGAISGGVRTLLDNVIFGAPFKPNPQYGVKGHYRTGGIADYINKIILSQKGGLTLGEQMYVSNPNNKFLLNHELGHIHDQLDPQYGGWIGMYGRLILKMITQGIESNDFDARINKDLRNRNIIPN